MVVLIALFWLVLGGHVSANMDVSVGMVVYDKGNPQLSVAMIEDKLYEAEQVFRHHRIMTFDPTGVIAKDLITEDTVRWGVNSKTRPELEHLARHHFISKQMNAIYEAQVQYEQKFKKQYASDLQRLLSQGFLAGGFREAMKQDYKFEILETTQEYNQDPTFYAIAYPAVQMEEDYIFSVDHLGLVRFAKTRQHVRWAPVWDYADHGSPRAFNLSEGEKSEGVLIDRISMYER